MNQVTHQQKNTPKLRFPEFRGEWALSKLKEITKINQGLQIAISDRYEQKVPNSHFYITNEFIKSGAKKKYYIVNPPSSVLATPEDLLMTRTGNTGILVTGVSGAFHNNFFKISRDETKVAKKFLFYFLNLKSIQNLILRLAGTSTIPDLNHEDFYRIPISLPSLNEQKKIADFLTTVDEKISKLQKKIELLKKYKKGVMQKIFSQKIRFKDENGKDYPDWEDKNLGDLLVFARNGLSIDQKTDKKDGLKVTRIETISDNKIDTEKVGYINPLKNIEEYKLLKGDMLFSNINSPSQIGRIVYVDRDYELYHGMNLLCLRVNQVNDNSFIYYTLSSIKYKQYFESICNKAVNQASINQTDLKKTKMKIPIKKEQQKIAEFLSSIDEKVNIDERKLEQAKRFKKSLLQQMFI